MILTATPQTAGGRSPAEPGGGSELPESPDRATPHLRTASSPQPARSEIEFHIAAARRFQEEPAVSPPAQAASGNVRGGSPRLGTAAILPSQRKNTRQRGSVES